MEISWDSKERGGRGTVAKEDNRFSVRCNFALRQNCVKVTLLCSQRLALEEYLFVFLKLEIKPNYFSEPAEFPVTWFKDFDQFSRKLSSYQKNKKMVLFLMNFFSLIHKN